MNSCPGEIRLLRSQRRLEAWHEANDRDFYQEPLPLELRHDLVDAIARLPAMYRDVLILRDIDELTAPEVAQLLSISTDAVKSRLHSARAMIRERLLTNGYLTVRD